MDDYTELTVRDEAARRKHCEAVAATLEDVGPALVWKVLDRTWNMGVIAWEPEDEEDPDAED